MAKGRKSQPAEVKEAKGNPGKRKIAKVTTEDLPLATSDAPDFLSENAQRVWADVAPALKRINLLRETDLKAFARYCDAMAEYWVITEKLAEQDYTYLVPKVGGGDMLRVNPLFHIQERLAKRLDGLEDRFGLTPRARQEVMFRLANAPAQGDLLGGSGKNDGEQAQEKAASPLGVLGAQGQGAPTTH